MVAAAASVLVLVTASHVAATPPRCSAGKLACVAQKTACLLAVEAVVNSPVGLTLDTQGYLYICERGENKIRRAKLW